MKTEKFIDDCLEKFRNDIAGDAAWMNYESGSMLVGIKQMYDASGDGKYFELIRECMERLITEDGELKKEYTDKFDISIAGCGKLMFFMYDKTGDEKYRNAIENIMNLLRENLKRLSPDELIMTELYTVQPFYMEYETKYDKKAKYSDIVRQFENAYSRMPKENLDIDQIGLYMMSLIDTLSVMSFEIYEKYRALQDIFKLSLTNLLNGSNHVSNNLETSYCMENTGNAENAMIAYSVIKACRMGVILKEKYAPVGAKIVKKLMEDEGRIEDIFRDKRAIAPFISAYGQYVQLKKDM